MKTIDRPKRNWLVCAGVLAALGALLGSCGNGDEGGSPIDNTPVSPITVTEIIASPKSADPGDTLLLSAVVTSSSPNETEIPTMAWTATGGAFLETNQTSVRWVAPSSGVYTVSAKATNSVSSSTGSFSLFVGGTTNLVNNQGGAVRLQNNGTDLFYLRTSNNLLQGTEVFAVTGGVPGDAVDLPTGLDGAIGDFVTYAPNLSFEAHSADSTIIGEDTQPIHLYLGDFVTKTYRRISPDVVAGQRHGQFSNPDIAVDNRSVAYGGMLPAFLATDPDTFDVFVDDVVANARVRVTGTHTNRRNAFPTWATNQSWLTFVTDRSGRNQWDLYGLPVTGGVVNTAQSSLVRLSNTGGQLASGNMGTGEFVKPLMAWNPVAPTVAVVAVEGSLYIIATTPAGGTQTLVYTATSGATFPTELAWSPDGSELAVTIGSAIRFYAAGGAQSAPTISAGDSYADMAWSPDGAWFVFRVTRGSSAWLEVVDPHGDDPPIAITAAEPGSGLGAYRSLMSMSPVWSPAGTLFYPSFATGGLTVGITSVDVSGLTP